MTRTVSVLLFAAMLALAGAAIAADAALVRSDLTPEDQARVDQITAPTTDFSAPERFENRQGGAGTYVDLINADAFSHPSENLDFAGQEQFNLGNALFRKVWVSSPSSTLASDGLGPLFNSHACQSCHLKDGRGRPPLEGEQAISMFLRLSVPPSTEAEAAALENHELSVIGHPVYGTQLQNFAVPGVPAEGEMQITYEDRPVELADGTVVTLREPTYTITGFHHGDPGPDLMISPRLTPQMIGLGLLEAIAEEDIQALADPDDLDGDGISGRPNWALDHLTGDVELGRFGWKAGEPNIAQQAAGAFAGDIGISSPLASSAYGDCTSAQTACLHAATGVQPHLGDTEAPDPVLELVAFYSRNLAVPQRRNSDDPQVLRGKQMFYESGCTSCHTPKFVTSRDAEQEEHRFQLIWPYTDMLLHDMGEGLADHRPEGAASGTEWRTPPLWGIGLTETVSDHTFFLHDGRARNLLEAVLWHGGEAEASQQAVIDMSAEDRDALIAFLESL